MNLSDYFGGLMQRHGATNCAEMADAQSGNAIEFPRCEE
jgi:hypothetical protein